LVGHAMGRGDDQAWPTATAYVFGVLPVVGALAPICAVGIDLWLRRRRPGLQVREPRGVQLGRHARRNATRGVAHPCDGWALGHTERGSELALSDWEMRHHTLICGATGAGKTSVALLFLEAVALRCPVVLVDFKANGLLRTAVTALGGTVWTMD